ncbi:hypothetical protein SAMN05444266_104158 [Chitinophaga jiangningensis]|uniref:Uncharacterized protein n=1 Tax=Chitinophaga jiangningensis TaxID=1419482 RepID=A0A1M7C1R2_9BACT|nr:hypothetical protein [Chitinophaga jiangningensis]SHL61086.1 hypothetical protein SAMN05444266_104158 [Chitinophaga jiangningensis]
MEIYVSEEAVLQEIQKKFSEFYPHLRIEFYKNPHDLNTSCPDKEWLDNSLPVDEVRIIHTAAWINISPEVTTGALEQAFYDLLGLSVQIYRKEREHWIETTTTDIWTLGKQEEVARREGSVEIVPSPDDVNDGL